MVNYFKEAAKNKFIIEAKKTLAELDPIDLGCLYILPDSNVLTMLEKKI
jgi:hypothetical protein